MGQLAALGAAGGGGGGFSSSSSSTSGDAKAGDVGGGISSPVVIGGFKSDGSASAFSIPPIGWVAIAVVAAYLLFRAAK